MYVSNISKSPGYTIWVASSMSSPLVFQTEGPGFESHQGHICCCCFFNTFFSHHSLKNSAPDIFLTISIVLVKFEASQYLPKLGFWKQYPLSWRPDSGIIIMYIMFRYQLTELTVLCWCVIWLWLFLDIFLEVTYLVCDLNAALSGHLF